MDIVFIQGLKIDTIIGIYDWERKIRQDIVLDIEMSFDIKKAGKSDKIELALNYKDVSKRIITFVKNSKFKLIETLAEKITEIIITEFNVEKVKLTLNKGEALTGAKGVGVIINRCKMANIHINIGSNENRKHNINIAIKELKSKFEDLKISSVYESPAVGFKGDDFYNVGVNAKTNLNVNNVQDILKKIEFENGRKHKRERFSSRTIDLDLVLYDDLISKELNLPRDDIFKYNFVLLPLKELNPEIMHPIKKIKYNEISTSIKKIKVYNSEILTE
jgi:2-amino-4-hydroxy-6-hydroxymethyldihydropteridine diphosphokinase